MTQSSNAKTKNVGDAFRLVREKDDIDAVSSLV